MNSNLIPLFRTPNNVEFTDCIDNSINTNSKPYVNHNNQHDTQSFNPNFIPSSSLVPYSLKSN